MRPGDFKSPASTNSAIRAHSIQGPIFPNPPPLSMPIQTGVFRAKVPDLKERSADAVQGAMNRLQAQGRLTERCLSST